MQTSYDDSRIEALRLESGERRVVVDRGYAGIYVPSGHIVYELGGSLAAVPFDADRPVITGPPATVLEGVQRSLYGERHWSLSETGTLVYPPQHAGARRLVWVDRQGNSEAISGFERLFFVEGISPDGLKALVVTGGPNDH